MITTDQGNISTFARIFLLAGLITVNTILYMLCTKPQAFTDEVKFDLLDYFNY